MKRLLAPAVITVAALTTLAACGSGDDDASVATTAAAAAGAPGAPASTVNVTEIEGFGAVLTDAEGRALYMSDEEADPGVVCTDACEEFWAPLGADSETPTGADGVDELGVADRPDGSMQVTYDGHRLYTFTQDPAGEVTGDGFSDTFGGQRFTWHAVVVDDAGATAEAPAPTEPSSGLPGYGY
jgi:predicted lipoprotein with Yx(FWY)xxD motif